MDQSSLAVLPNKSFSPPVNRRPVEEYEKNLTQSTGIGDISLNEFGLSRDISWHTPPPQTMSPFSNRNISGRYTGGDMIEFPFDAPAMIDISDDLMQFSPPRGPSFPPGRNIPFCELKGRDYNLPPSPPLPGNSNGSPYGVSPKAAYRLSPGYIQPPGSDPTKPVIKMVKNTAIMIDLLDIRSTCLLNKGLRWNRNKLEWLPTSFLPGYVLLTWGVFRVRYK